MILTAAYSANLSHGAVLFAFVSYEGFIPTNQFVGVLLLTGHRPVQQLVPAVRPYIAG